MITVKGGKAAYSDGYEFVIYDDGIGLYGVTVIAGETLEDACDREGALRLLNAVTRELNGLFRTLDRRSRGIPEVGAVMREKDTGHQGVVTHINRETEQLAIDDRAVIPWNEAEYA